MNRNRLKKVFSPDLGVEPSSHVLGIPTYACGVILGLALISGENPHFETVSKSRLKKGSAPAVARAAGWVGWLLLVAGLAVLPTGGHAAIDIPVPSWVTTTAVAGEMVINGLPSTVRYFHADRPLEDLLVFYRQRWDERHAGRAGYREAAVDPWHVISRLQGPYLLTVQAREHNGLTCEGFLAIADLEAIRKRRGRDRRVPRMAGSRVINDLTSTDPGRKGRTLMIVNEFSVARNRNFYRDHFLDRGWGRLQDQASGDAHVLAFRRFGQEAQIVIKPSSEGAVTVMNLVTTE